METKLLLDCRRGQAGNPIAWSRSTLGLLLLVGCEAFATEVHLPIGQPWSTDPALVFSSGTSTHEAPWDQAPENAVRAVWLFQAHRVTMANGELPPRKPDMTPEHFSFVAPELRDGVSIEGNLRVTFLDEKDNMVREIDRPLHVLDANPFRDRKAWLERLRLHVFDPHGTLSSYLDELDVPFVPVFRADTLEGLDEGIILVGEGLSLHEYPNLIDVLLAASARGAGVLLISPSDGSIPQPDPAEALSPISMSFRDNSMAGEMDKRLSAGFGLGTPQNLKSYVVNDFQVRLAVVREDGWPWMKAVYPSGGSFIYCGFPLISGWEKEPTSRYIVLRILEMMEKARETMR